jgi:hypothetical protein
MAVNSKLSSSTGPSMGSNAGAIAAGGVLASNTGTPNNTCSSTDQTFYCQMVRTLGMTQMIITFVAIFFAVIYILYYVYSNRKTLFK